MPFAERAPAYRGRLERALDQRLPPAAARPPTLHAAMRYAALGGGKRIRPLLCYATGELLGVAADDLDDVACALECVHVFSLIHDDLPAMDDDDLRRGKPSTHKAFGVATAILAGDALQTLAFELLARAAGPRAGERLGMVAVLASAIGSRGMTGGQAVDLESEGRALTVADLEALDHEKTGRLIRASVLMPCCAVPDLPESSRAALDRFAEAIGLAFQIRDDVLDVEGEQARTGKTHGADAVRGKATYPALLGLAAARRRAEDLHHDALAALDAFDAAADGLRWIADTIIRRDH